MMGESRAAMSFNGLVFQGQISHCGFLILHSVNAAKVGVFHNSQVHELKSCPVVPHYV